MIATTFRSWANAIRDQLTNVRSLAVFAALYAVLLVSLYIFISTREATVWQVLITYVFLLLLPAEFFLFQSAIITRARAQRFPWAQIARNALKIAVATIPMLLIAWGLWVLLNKWQLRYPEPLPPITFGAPPKTPPMHWPTTLFASLRFLLFVVALPLTAIHLWIEVTAQDVRGFFAGGAKAMFGRVGAAIGRAFASDSVFTYVLGLVLFVFIPYALLFFKINAKGTKTAFAIFIAQLLLTFVFTLVGWIVTVTALIRLSNERPEVAPATVPTPAEAPA